MSMLGSDDVRPFINSLKNIETDDAPTAWKKYKEKMRDDFDSIQKEKKALPVSFLGSIFGGRSQSRRRNVIDILESVVKEERIAFAKEQEQNKSQMLEIQKQHEEAIKRQLEENKSKNLKLWDYMMGAGQPANQNETSNQPAKSSWFQELFEQKPQSPQDQTSASVESSK